MNVKVNDIMIADVMTTTPHQTVEHVRGVLARHKVSSMPVVNPDGEPIGIITTTDLAKSHADGTPIGRIMPRKVYSVPGYADVSEAARLMRKHHIHHLVVTHERKVVGILSSFDLLQLLEGKRFTMKNAPTKKKNVRRLSGGRPETIIGEEM